MIKYLIKSLIFIAACVGLSVFCRHQTDGFQIYKISSSYPLSQEWTTPYPNDAKLIKDVLAQPFYYLTKGSQSFVFLSHDQKYVIKLIRYNHMKPNLWVQITSKQKCERLNQKLKQDLTSYKLAYEMLKKETALIFLHLNQTNYLHQKLTIVDKLGIEHTLDLDKTDFILQKRVQPFYPYLKQLMDENKENDAKALISHLISLLAYQYKKGIINTDVDLFKNFGCLDNQAVELDIGSLRQEPLSHDMTYYREEILKVVDCLHNKLSQDYPSLDTHLLKELSDDKIFI